MFYAKLKGRNGVVDHWYMAEIASCQLSIISFAKENWQKALF